MCINYWELFTKKNDFIFSHVNKDDIQHNEYQGTKYTWYPVYACPIVTGDPEHMIACVIDVIVAENDKGQYVVYDCMLLSRSKENRRDTIAKLQRVTVDGIMKPEQDVPFGQMILDLFPCFVQWMFASPIPVLEGQRNHELDQQ